MFKLILAGLLALPALLLAVVTAPIMALLAAPSLFLLLFRKPNDNNSKGIPDHVVITGGSSGIGLCVAKECVKRGIPKVTLLARNPTKLKQAQVELEQILQEQVASKASTTTPSTTTTLNTISVSVSDWNAISKVAEQLMVTTPGDHTILFHCAGISCTTYYQEIDAPTKYLELIQTNQLGVMYTTRAFLKYMERGLIVMTSSAAGQVGCFGYTGYSPTKFALRGFAEALHQELVTRPVNVQLVFPADTDTPGYREELQMMPAETKALNDAAGLATPEE
jgi:3-dehydrosphinganine reductase